MVDRKAQILDEASDLLQSRGYAAFSYRDLSDRLGITKATIHHHFPTKEALGVALTERYYRRTRAELEEISRRHEDPWDRFRGYVDLMGEVMQSGTKICPSGAVRAEHNVVPEKVSGGIGRLCRFVQDWLTETLAAGRRGGFMDYPGTPGAQAALVHAAVQGALQNARAEGPGAFDTVVRQIEAGMKPEA
jgi:TetR/AcrR family transcriptional repressor of nem operon